MGKHRPMNIYIGSAFTERFWCRTTEAVLADRGWNVCSSWHGLTDHDAATQNENDERNWAHKCFQELHEADVLLLFLAGHSEGGRWAEFGIAVAEHKRIVIVGETKNVFRHLSNVMLREEEDWIEAIDAIWRKGQPLPW